jgi:hypothetical protein
MLNHVIELMQVRLEDYFLLTSALAAARWCRVHTTATMVAVAFFYALVVYVSSWLFPFLLYVLVD